MYYSLQCVRSYMEIHVHSPRNKKEKKGEVTHPHVHVLCFVCLFDLACFFLSSFSSLIKNMYILMRDAESRKKEASKQQHNTPKAVTFAKKNELC